MNADKRRLYARLHSAGHLLDIAVEKMGLKWLPGKGYHFEDSPYVEYIGSPDGSNLEELRRLLDEECAKLIKETGQADSRKVIPIALNIIRYGHSPQLSMERNWVQYQSTLSQWNRFAMWSYVNRIRDVHAVEHMWSISRRLAS